MTALDLRRVYDSELSRLGYTETAHLALRALARKAKRQMEATK